jgi:ribosomal protein S18 acetylase RimI-like enzyme
MQPTEITVREATPADNDALIRLELATPLVIGSTRESFDRSTDFFASHKVKGEYRIVVAEAKGRLAGVMTGVIHEPLIQGQPRRLVYIQQARVHPDSRHQRIAWSLANDLFAWSGARGAAGPYYLIAPDNSESIAFVTRGGGRWPCDAVTRLFDVSTADPVAVASVKTEHLVKAADLINRTHAGEDFFEPLTGESLIGRLGRDPAYGIGSLSGVYDSSDLVAVGGLWDSGAFTERVRVDTSTGDTSRARYAAVVDWGWAAGYEEAFADVLRRLAAKARALGRDGLRIVEPSPGIIPETGLLSHSSPISVFTPTVPPPRLEDVRGMFFDLLLV